MNRTLILLLAVVLLGGVAWWASSQGQTPASVSDRSEDRQFAYPELDDVDRIFIADRSGHTVSLTRGGVTEWLADGKPANENVLKNLLHTISKIEVQSLPTQKAIPIMVNNLATSGILVQLFDKEGKKLRGYYVGGSTNDERGTFAIVEGSESPYIVHLPGWTGNLRHRLNLWDDEWRDKVYFRVDPDQVETFSIDYPKQRNKSFQLEAKGNSYLLKPLYENGLPEREVARGVVEGILSRYEKYYVNRYENQDEASITEAADIIPFAIIHMKEKGKEAQTMEVYPRFANLSFQQDPKTGEVTERGGLEAYTAFINKGEDWVLLSVDTTEPLLVGYDSF